jgi:repressor LexA
MPVRLPIDSSRNVLYAFNHENPARTTMLTERQQATYDFIREYFLRNGRAPKLNEIAMGIGIRSRGVVHRYLKAIADEGLIEILPGRHRGIRLLDDQEQYAASAYELPLLGKIAAGLPIEAIPGQDTINLAEFFIGPGRFVLRVQGDSMIDAGILDGDMVVVASRNHADNGDIVVALIDDDEATLKRIRHHSDGSVTLIPANAALKPIRYSGDRIQVQGVVVGQMRSYE